MEQHCRQSRQGKGGLRRKEKLQERGQTQHLPPVPQAGSFPKDCSELTLPPCSLPSGRPSACRPAVPGRPHQRAPAPPPREEVVSRTCWSRGSLTAPCPLQPRLSAYCTARSARCWGNPIRWKV